MCPLLPVILNPPLVCVCVCVHATGWVIIERVRLRSGISGGAHPWVCTCTSVDKHQNPIQEAVKGYVSCRSCYILTNRPPGLHSIIEYLFLCRNFDRIKICKVVVANSLDCHPWSFWESQLQVQPSLLAWLPFVCMSVCVLVYEHSHNKLWHLLLF